MCHSKNSKHANLLFQKQQVCTISITLSRLTYLQVLKIQFQWKKAFLETRIHRVNKMDWYTSHYLFSEFRDICRHSSRRYKSRSLIQANILAALSINVCRKFPFSWEKTLTAGKLGNFKQGAFTMLDCILGIIFFPRYFYFVFVCEELNMSFEFTEL